MLGANQSAPTPVAIETPRFLNDLSSLSSQPVATLNHPDAAFAATSASSGDSSGSPKMFLQAPGARRYVGTEQNPGMIELLNAKADQHSVFANDLGNHLFAELRHRERDDQIARVKLPEDLRPVIITATLTKDGKLTELVLEQHSGKTLVDNMFLDACKKALWSRNPPVGALNSSGVYRVRVEGRVKTWASTGDGRWEYKTWIGIGLL
jgi:hypothetical protein